MNKQELYNYMIEENIIKTQKEKELVSNILDEAEHMEEIEQYNFLCRMITNVPERILRKVCY